MDFKIELWLKGHFFTSEVIMVPEFDDKMSWEVNVKYRQMILNAQKFKMAADYHRQIDKCEGDYTIFLTADSKMKFIPVDEEDNF